MKPNYRKVKLELIGGQAKPGPTLASLGINMAQFTKDFNDKTKDQNGQVVPVLITIMPNKSFSFILKTTPVAVLLKKAANIEKGSGNQKTTSVATIPYSKVEEIAKYKMPDTTAASLDAMISMIIGTATQMGIKVEKK